MTTQEAFEDSADQDQTAQNVLSDLWSVTKGPVALGCCRRAIDTQALGRGSLGPQPQDSQKARGPSPLIVALK